MNSCVLKINGNESGMWRKKDENEMTFCTRQSGWKKNNARVKYINPFHGGDVVKFAITNKINFNWAASSFKYNLSSGGVASK